MPGPFVDAAAVASPTTAATPFKDLAAVPPVREGRSQSLTALPRRASTASVLTVESSTTSSSSSASVARQPLQQRPPCEQQQPHARQTRRALSSAASSSLSLLQEELGYPRRAQVTAYDGPSFSRRRSLIFDTTSDNNNNNNDTTDSNSRCRRVTRCQQTNNKSAPTAPTAPTVTTPTTRTTRATSNSSTVDSSSSSSSSNSISTIGSSSSSCRSTTVSSRALPRAGDDDAASVVSDSRRRSFVGADATASGRRARTATGGGDDDENFMDYRRASVTGYSRDTDGVVYYEVIVQSLAHGPLSAYNVRRRYSEFRALHVALRTVMAVAALIRIDDSVAVEDVASRADGPPTLPPLPDKGGVWSYLQFDSIPLLERRAAYFDAMLAAAQRHPQARASRLVNDFVGTPPDLVSLHSSVENSYVSLNRFAAPKLSFAIEIQERKEKAESIRRRRNSLQRQSFTGSLDASFLSPSQ